MGTNYFNPITYAPRQATTTPITMPNPLDVTIPGETPGGPPISGLLPGTPNSAGRAYYASRLALLPGRAATQMGIARNNARDATRGFGGINWQQDDPATANVDESLMMNYQPDAMGKNERSAVISARAAAAAKGILDSSQSDQMVGAGLQRVGEQARAIVNQYSGQINAIAVGANAEAQSFIGQITTLYGQDSAYEATRILNEQQATDQRAAAAAQTAATQAQTAAINNPPPAPVHPSGSMVWHGAKSPNLDRLNDQFGAGAYIVTKTMVKGKPRYTVTMK